MNVSASGHTDGPRAPELDATDAEHLGGLPTKVVMAGQKMALTRARSSGASAAARPRPYVDQQAANGRVKAIQK